MCNIEQVRLEAECLPNEFKESIESVINVWSAADPLEDELRDVIGYAKDAAFISGVNLILNELTCAHQHLIKVNELCEKLNKQIVEKGKLQNKKQERALAALVAGAVEYMNILEEKSNGT